MAEAKVQLGLDVNPFVRGVRLADRTFSNFATGAVGGLGRIATSMVGVTVGLAGIGIGISAAVRGLKGAFDFGDKLGEMSSQTGIAVRELVILEQGAKDAGLSMEALGVAVNRMQQKIVTGGKSLGELGVDLAYLKRLDPGKQFIEIGKAINGVADAAQRASIVKDIFGRGGGSLLAMFSDPNFGVGTAALTTQADLLERNAATFGRISDKLSNTGVVMRGFFLGVAETVAPALEKIIDRYEKFDWVANGKAFGDSLIKAADYVSSSIKSSMTFLEKADSFLKGIADKANTFLVGMGMPATPAAEAQRAERLPEITVTGRRDFWRFGDPRGGAGFNGPKPGFQPRDMDENGLERWGERMGVVNGPHSRRRSRTALANEAEREARRKDKAGEKVELGKTTTDALKAGFKEAAREIVVE